MKISTIWPKFSIIGIATLGILAVQNPVKAQEVAVDFSNLEAGQSIEGLGAVHEFLNIDDVDGAGIAVFQTEDRSNPFAYVSSQDETRIYNYGLEQGGFASNVRRRKDNVTNAFNFSFDPDVAVSDFSLELIDYGDWNPFGATEHSVSLVAYDAFGGVVDQFSLTHQTGVERSEHDPNNNIFRGNTVGGRGDAWRTTDASAFGNTLLAVSGEGIASVELFFDNNAEGREGRSSDPNVAFRNLAFTLDEPSVDVPEPASVMGLMVAGVMGVGSMLKRKQQG